MAHEHKKKKDAIYNNKKKKTKKKMKLRIIFLKQFGRNPKVGRKLQWCGAYHLFPPDLPSPPVWQLWVTARWRQPCLFTHTHDPPAFWLEPLPWESLG